MPSDTTMPNLGLTREQPFCAQALPKGPLSAPACDQITAEIASIGLVKSLTSNAQALAETPPDLVDSRARAWLAADPSFAQLADKQAPAPASHESVERSIRGNKTQVLRIPDHPVPGVVESSGKDVKVYRNEAFVNWGRTVREVPKFTFVPKTRVGVVNCVKFAVREGLRVRAAGTRHSWSEIYGEAGEVMISLVEIGAAVPLTELGGPDANPADTELEQIEIVSEGVGKEGDKAYVKLGAGVTADHFLAWTLSASGGKWKWMLPSLPVLVEITTAGWTQPMCHGAGRRHKSVSDFVVEMEVVNCKGEIQTISKKEHLNMAAGSFGFAGVVLSQTFVLDKMELAAMRPRKLPVMLSVPPVDKTDIPRGDIDFSVEFSGSDLDKAKEQFLADCDAFYSEWFWFPFQDECWVHCWDVDEKYEGGKPPQYLNNLQVFGQNLELRLSSILETTLLRLLPAEAQAKIMGGLAMALLPSEDTQTAVPDALHFRRGIHQLSVRDIELIIPIPVKTDGSPDFSVVQRLWWTGIRTIYEALERGQVPVRTTLEMRIVGDSDVFLSTQQKGEGGGLCSIEVLTNQLTDDTEWEAFKQEITDAWSTVINASTGEPVRPLPHWAKEQPGKIHGLPLADYLRKEFSSEAKDFKLQLAAVAAEGGYSIADSFRTFGNRSILTVLGEKADLPLSTPPKDLSSSSSRKGESMLRRVVNRLTSCTIA